MIGDCIQSNYHPASYGNNDECTISALEVDVRVDEFRTEQGYDFLTMGGTRYSGIVPPPSGRYSGDISWSSDGSVRYSGWKLCLASSPPQSTPGPCPEYCLPPADCHLDPFGCA